VGHHPLGHRVCHRHFHHLPAEPARRDGDASYAQGAAWNLACIPFSVRKLTVGLVLALAVLTAGGNKLYDQLPDFGNSKTMLWQDPGRVEDRDLRYGPGGKKLEPKAPFKFEKEGFAGQSPKVQIKDANGREWMIKFGDEARPDTFCSRLAWALGYYAEPNYFLEGEFIEGANGLQRARPYIAADGRTDGGRFQLRSKTPEYMDGYSWGWEKNPFVGTPQLNGLKILMMLVSNWDDKDIHETHEWSPALGYHVILSWMRPGSNNAIYRDGNRYLFFIDDWGASMGGWGSSLRRDKWDCAAFTGQTKRFVRRGGNGRIEWGYSGINTKRVATGIGVADVQWLMQYLGQITDEQLQAGLLASGASASKAACYMQAFRARIGQLEAATGGGQPRGVGKSTTPLPPIPPASPSVSDARALDPAPKIRNVQQ